MQADKNLKKVGKLYQQGLDSILSDLMIKQQLARTHNNDNDCSKAFAEQEKKFNELKTFLSPYS